MTEDRFQEKNEKSYSEFYVGTGREKRNIWFVNMIFYIWGVERIYIIT